jgi:hypothetical protein
MARVARLGDRGKSTGSYAVTGGTDGARSGGRPAGYERAPRRPWCAEAPDTTATLRGYDQRMRSLPTVLLVLSLPAGAIAYVVATQILSSLSLPNGLQEFLILIAPLFVAGLVMVPFLIPFFDRKAKADLAEHRRAMASAAEDGDAPADGAAPGSSDTVDVDDPNEHSAPSEPTAPQ